MRLDRLALVMLMVSIPVPIFIDSGGIYKGGSYDANVFALPLSLFVSALLLIVYPSIFKSILNRSFSFLLLLVFTWVVLFGFGVMLSNDVDPSLLLIYLCMIPVSIHCGKVLRYEYVINRTYARKVLIISYCVSAIFALLHVASSISSYGLLGALAARGEDSIFGILSIYQKLVYYPTILSLYFLLGVGLVLETRNSFLLSFGLLVLALDILIVGSRESFVIMFIGLLYLFYNLSVRKLFLFGLVIFLVTYIYFDISSGVIVGSDFVFLNKWLTLQESGDFSAGRLGATSKVFSASADEFSLFFGTFFSMSLGDLRTPHNQYLEILLRSGVVGLILFIVLIFIVFWKGYKSIVFHNDDRVLFVLFMALFVFLAFSFNINTPIRAPYSASMFYLLVGFFLVSPEKMRQV